jgi:hypothetical protein
MGTKRYVLLEVLDEGEPERGKICGFCMKHQSEVKKMVEADTGNVICNECIEQCVEILAKDA